MGDINKWPLERYSQWRNKSWVEIPLEKGNCAVIIKDFQLLLINKDIVLETVCLAGGAGFVKSSFSVDNLGILVQNQGNVSKFRVKFDNSPNQSSVNHCLSCVTELKKFIPVSSPSPSKTTNSAEAQMQVKTIHEVALMLTQDELSPVSPLETSSVFPEKFSLEELLRQCILDEKLPVLVVKVEKTLNKIKGPIKK